MFCSIRNTYFCVWIINIITTTITFACLILEGENTGSLLLTLILSGLALGAWLIIEIQLNGVVLTKLDKNGNPVKNTV